VSTCPYLTHNCTPKPQCLRIKHRNVKGLHGDGSVCARATGVMLVSYDIDVTCTVPLLYKPLTHTSAVDHSLIVLSIDADARTLPSGLNAIDKTISLCPRSVDNSVPVSVNHSLIVFPADARSLPSGLNATDETQSSPASRSSVNLNTSHQTPLIRHHSTPVTHTSFVSADHNLTMSLCMTTQARNLLSALNTTE